MDRNGWLHDGKRLKCVVKCMHGNKFLLWVGGLTVKVLRGSKAVFKPNFTYTQLCFSTDSTLLLFRMQTFVFSTQIEYSSLINLEGMSSCIRFLGFSGVSGPRLDKACKSTSQPPLKIKREPFFVLN